MICENVLPSEKCLVFDSFCGTETTTCCLVCTIIFCCRNRLMCFISFNSFIKNAELKQDLFYYLGRTYGRLYKGIYYRC